MIIPQILSGADVIIEIDAFTPGRGDAHIGDIGYGDGNGNGHGGGYGGDGGYGNGDGGWWSEDNGSGYGGGYGGYGGYGNGNGVKSGVKRMEIIKWT